MKKSKIIKIVASIGLSAVLLMGCGSKSVSNTTQSQSQTQTSKEEKQVKLDKENAITINFDKNDDYKTIYDSFKQNLTQAKEKYLNKTLKISGEVSKVEKKNGYIVVYIMSKNHSYDAGLYFKDNEENETKTTRLKKWDNASGGDIVNAYGIFEEFGQIPSGNDYLKVTNCEFI